MCIVLKYGIGMESEFTIEDICRITSLSRATVFRRIKDALEALEGIMNNE